MTSPERGPIDPSHFFICWDFFVGNMHNHKETFTQKINT